MTIMRWKGLLVVLLILCFLPIDTLVARADDQEIVYSYEMINRYPHDREAFTQGLVFHAGFLYEGTGLYGQSSLRKVRLEDGVVLEWVDLDAEFFGEGITILGDQLFQLTWREGQAFVYQLPDLMQIDAFFYQAEGWGLTTDGEHLIMSDGSHVLTFLDLESFKPVRQILVSGVDGPVTNLNELEYVEGVILANIWYSNYICCIDPVSGQVLAWIDLNDLYLGEKKVNPGADVLNGIAYDQEAERLFVTGKLWSSVYEIKINTAE